MTRVALTGTIGAAVLVVALGLFFVLYQQDQDEAGDATTPESAANSGGQAPAEGTAPAAEADTGAATTDGGQAASGAGATQDGQTAAPAQPAQGNQQAAVAGNVAVPPSFDVVRVNPSGDAVIAGRAQPGSEVTILDGDKVLGSVEADNRGEWVFLPDAALGPGEHNFSLESADKGAPKQESETSVVVIVPEVAKDIAGRASNQPAGALAIEVPKSGDGPTRVLNVPNAPAAASAGAPTGPEISAIDYNEAGRAVLSGRAPAGARLFVYVDNIAVGESVADEDGSWSFTPPSAIAEGLHVIRVDQVDETGKVLARVETPFEQAKVAVAGGANGDGATLSAGGRTIVVQPGNSLWKMARESYGQGVRYTVIYEANKDQIANPDLIYPGQVFSVPAGN
ncbi:MAG TPA: Ig-like domain-containing protein [Dongiaceae bacterium]|nr:Ig-like domain-containing protein [Dongiaceae bacterium]